MEEPLNLDFANEIPQNQSVDLTNSSKGSSLKQEQSNTLGLVSLIIAIVGIACICTLVGIIPGLWLSIIALILGIIAVFKKPRGKAIIGICVALLPIATVIGIGMRGYQYVMNFITPIQEELETRIGGLKEKITTIPEDQQEEFQEYLQEVFSDAHEEEFKAYLIEKMTPYESYFEDEHDWNEEEVQQIFSVVIFAILDIAEEKIDLYLQEQAIDTPDTISVSIETE